jgi:hypothetical protein
MSDIIKTPDKRVQRLGHLNIIVFLSMFICIFLIFWFDARNFAQLYPGVTPRYWFLDNDLDLPLRNKGPLMVVCTVLSIILCGFNLWEASKIAYIRSRKEEKYISTLIYYSLFYFGIARLVEFLYIPSDSDFYGINYVGQFHIAFDLLGFSIILVFAVNVFLSEYVRKHKWLPNFMLFLGFTSVAITMTAVLSYFFTTDLTSIVFYITIISLILLMILTVIAIIVFIKIMNVRRRVNERQRELLLIAITVLMVILVAFSILFTIFFFYILELEVAAYGFRLVKLIAHAIIIALSYISFIKPAFEKK